MRSTVRGSLNQQGKCGSAEVADGDDGRQFEYGYNDVDDDDDDDDGNDEDD